MAKQAQLKFYSYIEEFQEILNITENFQENSEGVSILLPITCLLVLQIYVFCE